MAETREQMAARLEDYAYVWANEGIPDTVTALRAGAAALLAQRWQPIETAPKDGTWILVSHPAWTDGKWEIAQWSQYSECWQTYDTGLTGLMPPTHWMPLPSPPETV